MGQPNPWTTLCDTGKREWFESQMTPVFNVYGLSTRTARKQEQCGVWTKQPYLGRLERGVRRNDPCPFDRDKPADFATADPTQRTN